MYELLTLMSYDDQLYRTAVDLNTAKGVADQEAIERLAERRGLYIEKRRLDTPTDMIKFLENFE